MAEKKSANNILIRNLSPFDQEILAELMVHFNEKTATQTIISLLRDYNDLRKKYEMFKNINESIQNENTELRIKLENIRKSFKALDDI